MKKIVLFLMLLLQVFAKAQPSTVGLVAYFPFNGNTTNNGSANITAALNNVSYTTNNIGTPNSATQFQGNVYSFIDFIDNGNLDFAGTNNFSICFGFYFNGSSTGGIFDNCLNYGGAGVWFWSTVAGTWNLQFNYKNNSVGSSAATNFTIGQWHHVVAMRNNGTISLYIDGVFRLSATEGTTSPTYPVSPQAGAMVYGGFSPPRYNPFGGKLDELRVYNRALTASEITAINNDFLTGGVQTVTLSCPANKTATTAAGFCSAVVNSIDPVLTPAGNFNTVNYTLTGATTGSGNGSVSGMSFNRGVTTVTYSLVSDPTKTCSFTITVTDNIVPSFTCPGNQNVTLNGTCQLITPNLISGLTGTDNCGTVTFSQNPVAGAILPSAHNQTHNVVITANDGNGNSSQCTVVLTGKDLTLPSFACPANQHVNLNGTCQLIVPSLVTGLTGSDNCGTVTFSQSPVAGTTLPSAHNQTHNVVITANDGNGNTSQCTVVLTGKDVTNPTFTCPANQNVNLNGTCQLVVPNLVSPLTGSDNCGTVTFTQNPVAGAALPSGHNQTHNVVITATDGNGNSTQCTVVLTGKDITNPTFNCPANQNVNLNGTCQLVVPNLVSALTGSDNCGTVTFTQNPVAGAALPSGHNQTHTVVITANDENGNSSQCTVVLTAKDITAPSINCIQPITVNTDNNTCGAIVNYGNSTTIQFSQQFTQGQPSPHCGSWDNFRSQLQGTYNYSKLTIKGSNDPVGVSVTDPAAVLQLANALRTGAVTSVSSGGRTWRIGLCGVGLGGQPAIELSAAGNICQCPSNEYIVRPCIDINYNPNWGGAGTNTCYGPTQVLTVIFEIAGGGINATDNCSGTSITQTAGLPSGSLFPVGTTTNTFEATDAAGNTSSCSFTVTVNDNEDPTFTCPANQNVNLNGSCQLIVPSLITGLTGSDNCGNVTFTQSPVAGTVLPSTQNQTHNVVITANDGNGNTSQCTVVLTGKDVTQPTFNCPANQNINLNGTCQLIVPNLVSALTGNDNCGTVTFSQNPVAGAALPSAHNQTHDVVITASDGNGNPSQCTVVLTGKDITNPTFTCPANQDVNLNGTCQLVVPNLVSALSGNDNCGTLTFTQNPVAGAALASSHNQIHNVVITANDGNGNTSQRTVVLTGKDVTQPVFTNCPSNITVSAATGLCSQVVNYTVTATDNCSAGTSASVNTLTGDVSNTDFNNAVSGLYSPSVTATKLTFTTNGYAHSHGSLISVFVDVHNPNTNTWTQVFAQQINGGGQFNFTGLQINFASQAVDQVRLRSSVGQNQTYHNWGGTTLTLTSPGVTIVPSHPSGSSFPVGTTTVTHTATDIAGNSATCTFTVTVTDDEKPTVTAPNTVDLECSSDLPAAATTIAGFLALPGASATDNCTPQANLLVSSSDGPLVNGNCNGSITRTYSITDAAGNTRNIDQVFTVTDNTKPTATAPNTVDLECSSDLPAAATTIAQFLALPGAAAGDNCTAQPALQVSSSDGPLVNGNCNGSITRTYTITDECGNTKSVDQVFTITDNTKPAATAPNTADLECSSDLPAAATNITQFLALPGAAANDNCTAQGSLLISSSDGPLVNGNCNGTITRTYTITDACGNFKSVDQVFTVTDNTNPTATAPNTVDLECSSDLPAPATTIEWFLELPGAAANDNCTAQADLLVSSSDGPLVNGNCNGTITRTYTITDACGNSKSVDQVFTVTDNTIPIITTCPGNGTTFIRNTNPGMCTYKITNTDFDAIGSDNCTGVTMSYSIANEHSSTPVTGTGSLANVYLSFGLNTITWKATDGCGNESAVCTVKVDVDKITTTSTLTVAPTSQQYSDLVTFTATVTPYNCTGAGNIGGTVTFKIGSLIIGQAAVINGSAVLTDTLIEDMLYDEEPNNPMNPTNGPLKPGAKTVTAYFSGTDADYIVTNPTAPLTVTCENADFTYNGQTYFTVSPNTNTGTVVLSNYVVDRNDVPTGARGDIRNATATFWQNAINGTVLGTANIPVGLVNPANYQEGFVTTSFTDGLSTQDISNGGKVYEVWSGLNNYYCGNSETYTPVTLGLPGQDFVTGGGYIVFGNNSAGTYAGTAGKRMNFGFVMKWNSSGKNLQGRVNVVYRKMVNGVQRIYQIKSNAINSLVVENVNDAGAPATGSNIKFRRATISTKANLADITDPLNPVSLGGNLSLTMIAWESTTVTTGALDRVSVQLSGSGSIGLLFSSNWSSGQTVHQTLNGGKIQVRNPNSAPPGQRAIVAPELVKAELNNDLMLKAYPNPSSDYFILDVKGNNKDVVTITVYNASGVKMHEVTGTANRNYSFGKGWISGSYFVHVQQGGHQKTVQLVKQ